MKTIYDLLKKPGFPSKWTDQELRNLLDEAYELISRPVGNVDINRSEPIITVATNELGSRSSKRFFWATFIISVAAIIVSLLK